MAELGMNLCVLDWVPGNLKKGRREINKERFNEKFSIARILFLHWPAGKTGWTNHITSTRILMFTAKQEHLLFSNDRLNFACLNERMCCILSVFLFFFLKKTKLPPPCPAFLSSVSRWRRRRLLTGQDEQERPEQRE